MLSFSKISRYFRFDGDPTLQDLDVESLVGELSEHMLSQGDVQSALRSMLHDGLQNQPVMGLQEMLQRLKDQKQKMQDKNNVDSAVEKIHERLEEIIRKERESIEEQRQQEPQGEGEAQPDDQSSNTPQPQASDQDPNQGDAETSETGEDEGEEGDGSGQGSPQQSSRRQGSQPGQPMAGQQGQPMGQQSQSGEQQQGSSSNSQDGQSSGSNSPGDGTPQQSDQQGSADDFKQALEENKLQFLENLPKDLAGAIQELSNYEFNDKEAEQLFNDLVTELRDQMSQGLQDMSQDFQPSGQPQSQMQEMLQQLNQMMSQQMQGGDTSEAMESFMQQWMPQAGQQQQMSLDQMMQQYQGQNQSMQSLLQSLSMPQREEMQDLMNKLSDDMGLREQLEELNKQLAQMRPKDPGNRHNFRGDDELDLQEALDLMKEMNQLDELERALRKAQYGDGLEEMDIEKIRELLGEQEAHSVELMKQLTEALEQAGYIRNKGDKFELTPKAMRMIGHKAMRDIFDQLKQGRFGSHQSRHYGAGVEMLEEAKRYEFGDPFFLDLQQTVLNAVTREGPGTPVRLQPADFDVYRTERQTQSSTVLMLDLSWSMARRGSFFAAKKVILALHSLIKTQFPRDSIYVVGFSTYARELKAEELPYITWDQSEPYTNMQQGLMVSQKLLSKHKHGSKQILMISDGEPTAHMERGQVYLGYPPSPRTITETLKEVQRCTHDGIVINVFMLDRSYYLKEFVDQITKINRGRAFYTSPDTLGQYVMVDYLTGKRRKIA